MKKTILITGCSKGIGLCTAETLKARGYHVFATARKEIDVLRLRNKGFEAEKLDLADTHSIDRAFNHILEKTDGRLDALLNNGGYIVSGAVEDLPLSQLREQFETNFFGAFYLTKKAIPIMRKQGQGRIIFISSINGFVAWPYCGAYCGSKFALEGLIEALAMELYQSPIFVSLIQPGFIHTDIRKGHVSIPQIEGSSHERNYKKMLSLMGSDEVKLPFVKPPQAVVEKVIHALEAKKPKFRYRVTLFAHLLNILKRILPTSFFIKLISKLAIR